MRMDSKFQMQCTTSKSEEGQRKKERTEERQEKGERGKRERENREKEGLEAFGWSLWGERHRGSGHPYTECEQQWMD